MMLSIASWWNGLGALLQVLYVLAILSSLILLVQLIIALFGFGDSGEMGGDYDPGDLGDGDVDLSSGDSAAGLRIFTVQGIVSFFVMFSWTYIAFLAVEGMPVWLPPILSFILGAITLLLMAKLMQLMLRLQESGNVTLGGAVGTLAQVYIPIPPEESGIGKVSMTYQNRFMECNAITRGTEFLKTDSFVKVVEVRGTTLVVEKAAASADKDKEEAK